MSQLQGWVNEFCARFRERILNVTFGYAESYKIVVFLRQVSRELREREQELGQGAAEKQGRAAGGDGTARGVRTV